MTQSAHDLAVEALSHAGQDLDTMERQQLLESLRITPEKQLPGMEFLFSLFQKPCFPRGELVALSGKPKSGKTFVSSILMALCFRSEVLGMQRLCPDDLRVLWFDTEQSDESTQDILKNRILPMIGKDYDPERFQVFNVRQEPWKERMPLLETAIEQYQPDLVIVDGIRDLVNDINDGELAQSVMERLMQLASEQRCCITCILHQNKNAEDKNLRGWIGTELTHKAFEVYECKKDQDRIFSLSQQLTRKYDILDTLKYVVDEKGIPQMATVEEMHRSEQVGKDYTSEYRPQLNPVYVKGYDEVNKRRILDLPLLFADAMPQVCKAYTAKEVQESVMKLANMTVTGFYDLQRKKALEMGVIIQTSNGYDHLCYYRPQPTVRPARPAIQTPSVPSDDYDGRDIFGEPPP